MKETIYLSGLPRSGSTLLANLLAMHPNIRSTSSSPLCTIVQGMRQIWSKEALLKSQLDNDFDVVYERLRRTTKATIESWGNEGDCDFVVDKNRGWAFCLEWLRDIYPDFKMIITLRDLRNIYASEEKIHRKTLMLDFADNMEHNLVDVRASALFDDNGVIGSCLKGLYNIGDIPDIVDHILLWKYEDLLEKPQETMDKAFEFLGVEPYKIDFDNIVQSTFETDSYYNMKFPHVIRPKLTKPIGFEEAKISPRILSQITSRFSWYYQIYYPELITDATNGDLSSSESPVSSEDQKMIADLEEAIKSETE